MSVIIPTWNGAPLLQEALQSLRAQTLHGFEVIVVDNGSTDETDRVLADFPEVRVVRFGENRGFAAAANAGIHAAAGEIVALLNNDARAEPGWLQALVQAMDADARTGSCASRMLLYDRPHIIDSAGDQLGVFASNIGHGQPDGERFRGMYPVLSASAGAAAYRRDALEAAGLFDERFFAYLEDVDLGVRLQLSGWGCVYVPDAVVLHRGSVTARRHGDFKYRLLARNSLFVFFQYMPVRRLLTWSWAALGWPLLWGLLDRVHPRSIWCAYAGFFRDLGTVRRIRAEWSARRHARGAAFTALLAPPWSHQRRTPR